MRCSTAGPDAEGVWESPPDGRGCGALLAHRRLSILDLSPAGAQPMIDPVTGQVIVFNGEIYNYVELRERLAAEGQRFESSGDTAVMLRALGHARARGARLAARDVRLRAAGTRPAGSSSSPAIRSASSRSTWRAAAIPPAGWSLAFASEVRALLASGLLGTAAARSAVRRPRWSGTASWWGPGRRSRGSTLAWPGRGARPSTAKAIRAARGSASGPSPAAPGRGAIDEDGLCASVLEEDVRLHLASDVPAGGVPLRRRRLVGHREPGPARRPRPGPHLHAGLRGAGAQRGAGRPAHRRGHRHAAPGGAAHRAALRRAPRGRRSTAWISPPSTGSTRTTCRSAIREAGFTVALAGTGGDELFGGYSSFRDLPLLHRLARAAGWLPRDLLVAAARLGTAGLRRSGAAFPPQTRWAKLPDMVRRGDDLLALYQLAYALFLPDHAAGAGGRGRRGRARRRAAAADARAARAPRRGPARRCRRSA